jgi:ABC-type bacteriocin/lantibiotic exporter with double-glycine peptidase domain
MPEIQGHIQIDDIGFRYGNRAVIRGSSLDIAPGEMIGLVGRSGSGKKHRGELVLPLLRRSVKVRLA